MIKQKKSHPEIVSTASPDFSKRAAAVIRGGGIIAFPTETYYGLGADPYNIDGLNRLFELKRRSLSKAILVIIDNLSQLNQLISDFPETYRSLIETHWPGPFDAHLSCVIKPLRITDWWYRNNRYQDVLK